MKALIPLKGALERVPRKGVVKSVSFIGVRRLKLILVVMPFT
jgi:hypothetical protein